ncbi:MAG: ribonuclease HI family protein [Acidobacteriota bacterium]|jgi:probable phosphoglycerate mutase
MTDHPAGTIRPLAGEALEASIDGGARGNPGNAGYGCHLTLPSGETWDEVWGHLGVQTNNVAEYVALLAALEYAIAAGAGSLRVRSDSQLLVRQILGKYRVKNPGLRPLFERARAAIARLPRFRIEHVYREDNREADALANRAMDTRESSGHLEAAALLGRRG